MIGRILGGARVRPGYWFVPKAFGWGATPATWQGWVATLLMVVAAALIANLAEHRGAVYLWLLAPLLLGFLWLLWSKTDGDWQWRWGKRN
ncbi:hypothetical protein [Sphingomonas sp. M1-B02]|uniref:hypothetical protein n=1 Tax=Sphingomonas sp. M1-B02 TaxID=3114300 RepID=UPI0022409CF0|nr:hypothetical protein [Sphingomonas sp. S6-11]UZK65776.1 hypothetical protein OKW87_14875 [Sphingomonas sp. S6-11]